MKSMLLASITAGTFVATGVAGRGRTGARVADRLLAQTQEALSRQEMLGRRQYCW